MCIIWNQICYNSPGITCLATALFKSSSSSASSFFACWAICARDCFFAGTSIPVVTSCVKPDKSNSFVFFAATLSVLVSKNWKPLVVLVCKYYVHTRCSIYVVQNIAGRNPRVCEFRYNVHKVVKNFFYGTVPKTTCAGFFSSILYRFKNNNVVVPYLNPF